MPVELPGEFLTVAYKGSAGSTEATSLPLLSLLGDAQQHCQYQHLGQSWFSVRKLMDKIKLSPSKNFFPNFYCKVLLIKVESEFCFHSIKKTSNKQTTKQKSYIVFLNSYLFSALDLAIWSGRCVSPSFKMNFFWYAEFQLLLLVWFKSEPSKSCMGIMLFFLFAIFFLDLPAFSKSPQMFASSRF